MSAGRYLIRGSLLAALTLLPACGGSNKPAESGGPVTAAELEKVTDEACQNLQSCELVDDNDEALTDCVDRGLYTVQTGTEVCGRSYAAFEACVADEGCSDLKALYVAGAPDAPCRKEADVVQTQCNVNVL